MGIVDKDTGFLLNVPSHFSYLLLGWQYMGIDDIYVAQCTGIVDVWMVSPEWVFMSWFRFPASPTVYEHSRRFFHGSSYVFSDWMH